MCPKLTHNILACHSRTSLHGVSKTRLFYGRLWEADCGGGGGRGGSAQQQQRAAACGGVRRWRTEAAGCSRVQRLGAAVVCDGVLWQTQTTAVVDCNRSMQRRGAAADEGVMWLSPLQMTRRFIWYSTFFSSRCTWDGKRKKEEWNITSNYFRHVQCLIFDFNFFLRRLVGATLTYH